MSAFTEDMAVKAAWGLDLNEWNQLTEDQRRYCRWNVAHAPHFQEVAR